MLMVPQAERLSLAFLALCATVFVPSDCNRLLLVDLGSNGDGDIIMPRLQEMPQRRTKQGDSNKTQQFQIFMNVYSMLFQSMLPYCQFFFIQTGSRFLRPVIDWFADLFGGFTKGPAPVPDWARSSQSPVSPRPTKLPSPPFSPRPSRSSEFPLSPQPSPSTKVPLPPEPGSSEVITEIYSEPDPATEYPEPNSVEPIPEPESSESSYTGSNPESGYSESNPDSDGTP